MPPRNTNLPTRPDTFTEEATQPGKYQNAGEGARDALPGMQERLQAEELNLDLLRTQIETGLQAIDRGAFTELDGADLDAALDELVPPNAR